MSPASPVIFHVPVEILTSISSHLPNSDIKNLRLTCRAFLSTIPLRLKRVFLSANPRNIDVFRAIADHDGFRQQIVEIIWDDARLFDPLWYSRTFEDEVDRFDHLDAYCLWFKQTCRGNLKELRRRNRGAADRPDVVARRELVRE